MASAAACSPAASPTDSVFVPAMYASDIDRKSLAELAAWREERLKDEALTDADRAFLLERSTLARYVVARNGDVEKAKKAIEETLQWRRGFIKRPLTCAACEGSHTSHCFMPLCIGEREKRVIIYSCQARAADSDVDRQMHHTFHSLEHAWAVAETTISAPTPSASAASAAGGAGAGAEPSPVPAASGGATGATPAEGAGATGAVAAATAADAAAASTASPSLPAADGAASPAPSPFTEPAAPAAVPCHSFTWLVDFAGFGFSHAMQARVGITAASILSNHLPERLHKLVLINPPGVFSLFLSAGRAVVDARTMSKLVTVNASSAGELELILTRDYDMPPHAARFVSEAHFMPGAGKPGVLPPLPEPCRPFVLPTLAHKF